VVAFDQLRYPELQRRFSIGPLLAQVRLPDNPQQRQDLLFGVLTKGEKDLEFRAEFYFYFVRFIYLIIINK